MPDMLEEREEIATQKGSFSALIKGVLIGGLLGAGFALLTAPRRGDETRAMLLEKGADLREQVIHTAEEARHRAEDLARQGTNRASELTSRGQQVLDEQKTNLESVVEGVREGVRYYRQQGVTEITSQVQGMTHQPVKSNFGQPNKTRLGAVVYIPPDAARFSSNP